MYDTLSHVARAEYQFFVGALMSNHFMNLAWLYSPFVLLDIFISEKQSQYALYVVLLQYMWAGHCCWAVGSQCMHGQSVMDIVNVVQTAE